MHEYFVHKDDYGHGTNAHTESAYVSLFVLRIGRALVRLEKRNEATVTAENKKVITTYKQKATFFNHTTNNLQSVYIRDTNNWLWNVHQCIIKMEY